MGRHRAGRTARRGDHLCGAAAPAAQAAALDDGRGEGRAFTVRRGRSGGGARGQGGACRRGGAVGSGEARALRSARGGTLSHVPLRPACEEWRRGQRRWRRAAARRGGQQEEGEWQRAGRRPAQAHARREHRDGLDGRGGPRAAGGRAAVRDAVPARRCGDATAPERKAAHAGRGAQPPPTASERPRAPKGFGSAQGIGASGGGCASGRPVPPARRGQLRQPRPAARRSD
mmetsp:Transcript_1917/g.6306  ORF Transcript_1917/g.6306 Transcript_1917/m.6306 type:complete len:230 (+) Transcript_1917:181-870(+)